jgi:hypothetical protein
MKRVKSLFCMGIIPLFVIMMFSGPVYGDSVTMQREGAPQNGQENTVLKNNVNIADNQLKFAPQRLKNKNDSDMESQAGDRSVRMEQYKPYKEGEGERKVK